MINELFWLLVAHFIGDFALQQSWTIKQKMKDPYVFIAHCFIWTGCISLVLLAFNDLTIWKVCFLFFGHGACDFLKHKWYYKLPFHLKNSIDQVFHILQLLIVLI